MATVLTLASFTTVSTFPKYYPCHILLRSYFAFNFLSDWKVYSYLPFTVGCSRVSELEF